MIIQILDKQLEKFIESMLLHGFIKKTRTVPGKEIQTALRKMKQFDGV